MGGCLRFAPGQTEVPSDITLKALDKALEKYGVSYVWGGRGPSEFDCSGLITWSYKKALGKKRIFRVGNHRASDATMHDLWLYNTVPLHPKDLQPGDVIFITDDRGKVTHGGLFMEWVDNNELKLINASSYYGQVVIDTWPLHDQKRGQWFVGAGRLKIVAH